MAGPEEQARAEIGRLLTAVGWSVQNYKEANLYTARGVALREFPLGDGYGEGNDLLHADAYLIRLTATPFKRTFGFFNKNLVMEYGHEQAVADGVIVNYDVYRIRTAVSEVGGKVESGYYVDLRDKLTRKVRWEQLDEEFAYDPNQLDRDVVAVDQIPTIVRTFRDKLPTEIFPGRTEVPKTLIFAKDDKHADDIVRIVREEFGKGNEVARIAGQYIGPQRKQCSSCLAL